MLEKKGSSLGPSILKPAQVLLYLLIVCFRMLQISLVVNVQVIWRKVSHCYDAYLQSLCQEGQQCDIVWPNVYSYGKIVSYSRKLKILDSIEGKALEFPKCFCATVDSTKYALQMILQYS